MTADGLLKLPRSVGAIKHCSIRRLCFIPVMVPLDLFFFKELLVISCFSFAVTEYFRMFFFLTPLFVYFSNKSCFFFSLLYSPTYSYSVSALNKHNMFTSSNTRVRVVRFNHLLEHDLLLRFTFLPYLYPVTVLPRGFSIV